MKEKKISSKIHSSKKKLPPSVINKLDLLFSTGKKNVLNIYCTAGYPQLESTPKVMLALQQHGADIIELGIPYSDPIADGPVIQQSNEKAIENGIDIKKIFAQLTTLKTQLHIPVILMGYLNPVMQYGLEKFCKDAAAVGVSGIILPDLPMYEYENLYGPLFAKYGLHFIFLISPQTSEQRIREADKLSKGFIYAVSSSATTGGDTDIDLQKAYFNKIKNMKLKNPVLIGFGIKDRSSFEGACEYAAGAIIGSAFIKALQHSQNVEEDTAAFIRKIQPL